MGLFKNLFSSKKPETAEPMPQPKEEPVRPRGIIKTQRHKLDNVEAHMEEIMNLVEKNENYKLSKKAIIEEGMENEKIYEYTLSETTTFSIGGVERYKYLCITLT